MFFGWDLAPEGDCSVVAYRRNKYEIIGCVQVKLMTKEQYDEMVTTTRYSPKRS